LGGLRGEVVEQARGERGVGPEVDGIHWMDGWMDGWMDTFRCGEMNDVSIFLEHVHLLYCLDRLHVEFLERGLQFLVVGSRGFVRLLLLRPPGRTLSPALSGG